MGSMGSSDEPPPLASWKSGPLLANIFIFSILLFFSRLFFAFFSVFCFLANIDIHDLRIHYHFLTFFLVLANASPTAASGPPSVKFSPLELAHTSSYTIDEKLFTQNVTNVTFIIETFPNSRHKKCRGTWHIISPLSEKSGHVLPHLICAHECNRT